MSQTRDIIDASSILPAEETFIEILDKAIFSHQTWASFFGSMTSTVGTICLNYFFSYLLSNAEKLRNEEIVKKQIGEAFAEAMHRLEKSFFFHDARAMLNNAKLEFEGTFSAYLSNNFYYQQLYTNIIYALAISNIYLGELDLASNDINQCLNKFPEINHRKHDMYNLLGIISLKNGSYDDARKYFSISIQQFPNQQHIMLLKCQCFLKSNNLLEDFTLTKNEATDYLSNTLLFQTTTLDPYIFEVNISHIESLIRINLFELAFEKLNALEKQYSTIPLSVCDQARLYKLFRENLLYWSENAFTEEEVAVEQQKLKNKYSKFFEKYGCLPPECPNIISKEKLLKLENHYRIKELVLNNSDKKYYSNDKNSDDMTGNKKINDAIDNIKPVKNENIHGNLVHNSASNMSMSNGNHVSRFGFFAVLSTSVVISSYLASKGTSQNCP